MKNVKYYKLQKIFEKLKPYIKMDKEIIKFDDTEIEENEFHQYKSLISINGTDINKIVVSHRLPFGE